MPSHTPSRGERPDARTACARTRTAGPEAWPAWTNEPVDRLPTDLLNLFDDRGRLLPTFEPNDRPARVRKTGGR